MRSRLKLIVPIVQVSLVILVFILGKLPHDQRTLLSYVLPAQKIVKALNFPLVIAWFPVLYSLGQLVGPALNRGPVLLVSILIGLALILTVIWFWYLVVVEVSMRRQGASLIRFSSRWAELTKAVIFLALGFGTLLYVLLDLRWSWHVPGAQIEGFVTNFFAVLWGLAFIGLCVSDLRVFLHRKERA